MIRGRSAMRFAAATVVAASLSAPSARSIGGHGHEAGMKGVVRVGAAP